MFVTWGFQSPVNIPSGSAALLLSTRDSNGEYKIFFENDAFMGRSGASFTQANALFVVALGLISAWVF